MGRTTKPPSNSDAFKSDASNAPILLYLPNDKSETMTAPAPVTNPTDPVEGGCQCGANRYSIPATKESFDCPSLAPMAGPNPRPVASSTLHPAALPFPTYTCHCHCGSCRHSVGALWVTLVPLVSSAFSFTKSESLKSYKSSPYVTRTFCGNCGTSMTYKAEGREWMAVCAGSLDEPDRVVANMHVHGESMLRGFERPDPQVPFWNGKYRMVYGGNGKGEVEKTNAEILEMNASLMD